MSDRFKHTNNLNNSKAFDDDKHIQVFRHLESANQRNKAAFDELLRYTYSNLKETNSDNENK